jgi:MFS family permease
MSRTRAAGIIALATLAKFSSAPGQSFFIAVFVDHLIAGAGVSRTGFALLYGFATVFSASTVLGIGRAIDRRGIGLVWVGVAFGLSAGCALMSLAYGPLLVFVALCMMRGFGQGSFPLLGTVLVASSFERARGRAFSISAQGIAIATAILPGLGVILINSYGWRSALRLVAAALILVVAPLGLVARRGPGRRPARRPKATRLRETIRMPGVRPLLCVFAVPPLVVTAIVVNSVSLFGAIGLGAAAAAGAIGAMAISAVFGTLIGGVLVDRFRPGIPLAAMAATLAVAVGLFLIAAPLAAYVSFVALGAANGLYTTANGALWAETYGTEGLARLQSLASSGQILGAALGPLPLALSLTLTGGYTAGLVLLGALALIGLLGGRRWARRSSPRIARIRADARRREPGLAGEA